MDCQTGIESPEITMPAGKHVGMDRAFLAADAEGLRNYGRLCVRAGVTTSSDLGQQLNDDMVGIFETVTGQADYPVCLVAFCINLGKSPAELVDYTASLKDRSTQRLELGKIKVIADGSIQGFSARLQWPGYYNGAPNGLWYIAPDQMADIYQRALAAGFRCTRTQTETRQRNLPLKPLKGRCVNIPILTIVSLCNTANWRLRRNFVKWDGWGCA